MKNIFHYHINLHNLERQCACPSMCIFAELNEEWRESRDDQLGHGTFDKSNPTETSLELPNLFLYLPV